MHRLHLLHCMLPQHSTTQFTIPGTNKTPPSASQTLDVLAIRRGQETTITRTRRTPIDIRISNFLHERMQSSCHFYLATLAACGRNVVVKKMHARVLCYCKQTVNLQTPVVPVVRLGCTSKPLIGWIKLCQPCQRSPCPQERFGLSHRTYSRNWEQRASLLGAPGRTTRNKKLLRAPGRTTSNKKLLVATNIYDTLSSSSLSLSVKLMVPSPPTAHGKTQHARPFTALLVT